MFNNYNPYYVQPRYPAVDTFTQPQMNKIVSLLGKSVDSVDVVKAADVPLDGSISYFPLTDGSAIYTKQLKMDGTSKIMAYKPVEEGKEEIKFITSNDLDEAIKNFNDELSSIKQELEKIKDKEN